MHTPIPFPTGFASTDAGSPPEMTVVLAYENLSAALWASETLAGLIRQVPDEPPPRLLPWNFSTLGIPEHCAEATAAALRADLIVIATSSAPRLLPESIESWLGKCLADRPGGKAAVAALFRRADLPDRDDSPRLQTVQRLAREAGCEFFSPSVNEATLSVA